MALGVHSEVGQLRKVMVHRPDLSLQRLTPTNHDGLLFDDVLWVERAQYEHDQFVARMRERGVEVFLLAELLAEALAASAALRQRLIELVVSEYTVGWSLVDEIRTLLAGLAPQTLATHLIGGLTVGEAELDVAARDVAEHPFVPRVSRLLHARGPCGRARARPRSVNGRPGDSEPRREPTRMARTGARHRDTSRSAHCGSPGLCFR